MNATLQARTDFAMGHGRQNRLPGNRISVVFISHAQLDIPVKDSMNTTLTEERNRRELRQENGSGPDTGSLPAKLKTPQAPETAAFANWVSAPERADDLSTHARHESNLFDASLRALNRGPARDPSRLELKLVEFSLDRPEASWVQLAADFTDWERSPIDMVRSEAGCWSTTVPLPPGVYAYRFLVDGRWYDDPRAVRLDPNSTCAVKSYIQIK
jgi:hypothetical protein